MGMGDAGLLSVGNDMTAVMLETLQAMVDEDSALISIYYGQDVKEEEANKILSSVQESFPTLEVELEKGDQPVYYYVFSVE